MATILEMTQENTGERLWKLISDVPGHWYRAAKHLIRVRYSRKERCWHAWVYWDIPPHMEAPLQGQSVLGNWPDMGAAYSAAVGTIGMDPDRVCSPSDIVKVRRELAKAK